MDLLTRSGNRMRKQDVSIAKNYLSADKIETLNRLVVIFLEQAELRVKQKQQLTLDHRRKNVDRLLEFNDHPVLQSSGSRSAQQVKAIAYYRYDLFNVHRRQTDAEDLRILESAVTGSGKM